MLTKEKIDLGIHKRKLPHKKVHLSHHHRTLQYLLPPQLHHLLLFLLCDFFRSLIQYNAIYASPIRIMLTTMQLHFGSVLGRHFRLLLRGVGRPK